MPARTDSARCPNCREPMDLTTRKLVLFSQGLDTESYRCGTCDTEATLTSRAHTTREMGNAS
jgi:DNA-directed RNA polymerase subunit RPC12/RpoP